MLTLSGSDLPKELLQLPQPPQLLHVLGAPLDSLLSRPRLAVVGSRKMSAYGQRVTRQIVMELASRGVVIVSGLALGVDAAAHQACLDAGGQTIAVLPCGPEQIYPAAHSGLAKEILLKGGAIVTEYEKGTTPYPSNFLARNRIVAALGDAVLITEAAERSGTLNTANHALDLGKSVFAVPGNIDSPYSAGCNNLIKMGAMPVTSLDDIVSAMGWRIMEQTGPDKRSLQLLL